MIAMLILLAVVASLAGAAMLINRFAVDSREAGYAMNTSSWSNAREHG